MIAGVGKAQVGLRGDRRRYTSGWMQGGSCLESKHTGGHSNSSELFSEGYNPSILEKSPSLVLIIL